MKKRNLWPFFFIGLFSFSLYMISWTIYNSVQSPVHEDESFLEAYYDVDNNFNNIAFANVSFLEKYDFELKVNEQSFDLSFEDINYSQRVIEKKSLHKNALNVDNNILNITIKDKQTGIFVENAQITIRVMTPTNNNNNHDFNNFEYLNNSYTKEFSLPHKGNYNLTGKVSVNGQMGHIFIKTNAI